MPELALDDHERDAFVRHFDRVSITHRTVVVVSYEQQPARIITALANRTDPKRWKP